mgnify:FL=1
MKRQRSRLPDEAPKKRTRLAGGVTVARRGGGKVMEHVFRYPPLPSLSTAFREKGKDDNDYIVEVEEDGSTREIFRWHVGKKAWVQLWCVSIAEERVQKILEECEVEEIQEALVAMIKDSESRLWEWARWTVVDVLIRQMPADPKFPKICASLKEAFDKQNPTIRPPWEETD